MHLNVEQRICLIMVATSSLAQLSSHNLKLSPTQRRRRHSGSDPDSSPPGSGIEPL